MKRANFHATCALAAVLISPAASSMSLPELIRETQQMMVTMDTYGFDFDVEVVEAGRMVPKATVRGSVYRLGSRVRTDLQDLTYLTTPDAMFVINRKEGTVSCSRFDEATRHVQPEIRAWPLDDESPIEDLGESADGRGFAIPGRAMGIARTEIHLDVTRKLPTRIVYHYQKGEVGGTARTVIRYRWKAPASLTQSLVDPGEYLKSASERCDEPAGR